MFDVMKTFACVSLQSTVKGFILFSFTDRSLALLVQRCFTVFVTTLLALVSCSCVFDKNTRANINIGTTDEYVQFNMYCARNRENGREKWDVVNGQCSIEANVQMNRHNTSNDGNAFIDIDDGNHYSTIFIATFSASSKYVFDPQKNSTGKKKRNTMFARCIVLCHFYPFASSLN